MDKEGIFLLLLAVTVHRVPAAVGNICIYFTPDPDWVRSYLLIINTLVFYENS